MMVNGLFTLKRTQIIQNYTVFYQNTAEVMQKKKQIIMEDLTKKFKKTLHHGFENGSVKCWRRCL